MNQEGITIKELLKLTKHTSEKKINPIDPETWDEEYKKRQQELAGIPVEDRELLVEIIKSIK